MQNQPEVVAGVQVRFAPNVHPFPGKRKYRWIIATHCHGVIYEGKPSGQAMCHAIAMSQAGFFVHLIEFDRKNPYCSISFVTYEGSTFTNEVNVPIWQQYHKMDVSTYYSAWRRKSRGMGGRKKSTLSVAGE
jgi:hypothetical protein